MTTEPHPSLAEILLEALAFPRAFESLLLATANTAGQPHASYAIYVADDTGCLHIYISALAAHTQNLLVRPVASVLFIEDESRARHLFARRRLTCDCRVERISMGTPAWDAVLARFVEKHGGFMEMLKGLKDFQFFRLVPQTAIYVRGFGQAFELSGEQLGTILPVRG